MAGLKAKETNDTPVDSKGDTTIGVDAPLLLGAKAQGLVPAL